MNKESILPELQIECPFSSIFEDKETVNGYSVFRRKIGHIQC